ncbi:MAG: phosphodiester glycosidase family protein [Treponema sp.]|jgi:exopolysaccharide biosynthesis protein|nr:phosphodiester glycosidase family protein [Treponema sp.]
MKMKRRWWGLLYPFIGFALVFALLFYGPFEPFRLLWINTAVYSSHYKFLATALYPKAYIETVLQQNAPLVEQATNDAVLNTAYYGFSYKDTITFVELKGNYFRGCLIKIADPRRLFFAVSDDAHGLLLEQLVARHSGLGGINASGYISDTTRGLAWGTVVMDGAFMNRCDSGEKHTMGGFNAGHKLVVGHFTDTETAAQGYRWAFEFGPLLIVNGDKTELTVYSGGFAPRSAIGQTSDGSVLLVTVDGRQPRSIGATYRDMQTILYANGAINAIGLDGGSSTTMVYQSRLVNKPSDGERERLLPNGIIFK